MALIELHHRGELLRKVMTASIGHEPGEAASFMIAGEALELGDDGDYALVIDGIPYPLKDLKVAASGKVINAILR